MRALTYAGIRSIRHENVADPTTQDPTDAIVQVECAGLCGSDLHVYHGRETGLDPGTVMGHEFVGRVVSAGAAVRRVQGGDRVVSPFTTSCGNCFYCLRGLSARCVSGRLFGWVQEGAGLQGCQTELVRVPLADSTLVPIEEDLPGETAVLLADVLPTGWHCALGGGVRGGIVVVIGCGPVGLAAVVGAMEQGADRVLVLDSVPQRRAAAERFGATALPVDRDETIAALRDATEGRGADAVLEAVGSEAAGRLAFDLVRPGGVLSMVGVHHESRFPISPVEAYDKNLTLRIGRCPARSLIEELIPLVRRRPELGSIVTHRLPLEAGPQAYDLFDRKEDGCIKVAFTPDGAASASRAISSRPHRE